VLHLPDVAELMRQQVIGPSRIDWIAENDRAPEGVTAVTAKSRQSKEQREHDHPHALDPDSLRIERERVEAPLGTRERGGCSL
jgi:hypothetical protein